MNLVLTVSGLPQSDANTEQRRLYVNGVLVGSLVLMTESLAMFLYSPLINPLINKFGAFCQIRSHDARSSSFLPL